MNTTELLKMQERLDTLKSNRERNKWALAQNMKQLKSEFGVTTLDDAERMVKTIKKDIATKQDELGIISQKVEEQLMKLEEINEI